MRQRPGGGAATRLHVAAVAVLLLHLLLVGWLTLRPVDVPWVTAVNLRPFAGIRADLASGPTGAVRGLGCGMALLAPLGALLPLATGRASVSPWSSLARTAGTGVLVSLAIALLQTGVPGQVPDVDSLILNTVGVTLTHAVCFPLVRAALRRARGAGSPISGSGYPASTRSGSASLGSSPGVSRPTPGNEAPVSRALPGVDVPETVTPSVSGVGLAP